MKTSIYTAYHGFAPLISSKTVVPIHVGRGIAQEPLHGMIGDNSGESISERNPEYCELTALFWAWKNDLDSDWLGLMHYSRVFDFAEFKPGIETEQHPSTFNSRRWGRKTDQWIRKNLDSYDVVLPKRHSMGRSMKRNYDDRHSARDWKITRQVLAELYPGYLDAFDAAASENSIYLANMMLMRRALFERYCSWLFDILFRVEADNDGRHWYSSEQTRYAGFLAERLLTVFIRHELKVNPSLRVQELNILNLKDATVYPLVGDERFNGPKHINISFSADRAYLPHAAAMLRSLLDHADPQRQLNLFFLYSGIGARGLELLAEVAAGRARTTLHMIKAEKAFAKSHRSPTRAPSNATYNRFLLFELLPGIDRLLYVDSDTIFRGDVAQIFDTDIGDAQVGAVVDYIMTRVLTGPTATADSNVPDLYLYFKELGFSDEQISTYFNAGLILFNFKNIDLRDATANIRKMARSGKYLFRDQDILNVYFRGSVFPLDDRFNVFNTFQAGYNRVPRHLRSAALEAKSDPVMIHYAAGDHKPWLAAVPMGQFYWDAISRTPFYFEVLSKARKGLFRTNEVNHAPKKGIIVRTGKKVSELFPFLRPGLLSFYRWVSRTF